MNSSTRMLSTPKPERPALPFTPSSLDWNLQVSVTSDPERVVHSSRQSPVSALVRFSMTMWVMSTVTDLRMFSESNQTTELMLSEWSPKYSTSS